MFLVLGVWQNDEGKFFAEFGIGGRLSFKVQKKRIFTRHKNRLKSLPDKISTFSEFQPVSCV